MSVLSIILTILGLSLFETIGSIDNAIINAQALSGMGKEAKQWFLSWGLLISVFLIRGVLPWAILWIAAPSLGVLGVLTAVMSKTPAIPQAFTGAAPVLLVFGGTFLLLLFCHWLFLEEKAYGLYGERFIYKQGIWFFAVASVLLAIIVWQAIQIRPLMAFGAVLGSSIFFITSGFRENARTKEAELLGKGQFVDMSKIVYLLVIDATFSMDEVLGAFAFTFSVPLILIGTGLGAIVVRQLTVSNIENIKKYTYLENGAMYSILFLSLIMLLNGFGFHIPDFVSPIITFLIVGYFFIKSKREMA